MQDPTMLIRVSGALVVGYILQRLLRSLLSPLRAVPGPFLARCSDLWYLWHVKRGHWEIRNIELHQKHGKSPPARPEELYQTHKSYNRARRSLRP